MIRKMIDCQKKFTIIDMTIEVMDEGTKSILGPFCGLARGNPQLPGVLGLSSKS